MNFRESFVERFLDFLNDESADARRVEGGFSSHQWSRRRLFIFQSCPDRQDYKDLRFNALQCLKAMQRETAQRDGRMMTIERKKKWLARLNNLAFKIQLKDQQGNPLTANGKPVVWSIAGEATFKLKRGKLTMHAEPAPAGVEFCCYLALLLISDAPENVRTCQTCGKYFNLKVSQSRKYCAAHTTKRRSLPLKKLERRQSQ